MSIWANIVYPIHNRMCKLINLSEQKALLNSVEKKAAGEVCRDYPTGGRIRKS